MKYVKRQIEQQLLKAAKQFSVVGLTGPRQSGKSTLLKHLFPDHNYLTFDDPLLRNMALDDPALFMENLRLPIVLDEIQYTPDLLSYIKIATDKNRDLKGQFLLTGSQIFHLMAGISETLAGRIALFELLPFSLSEISQNKEQSLNELFQLLHKGFYPDPCVHEVAPEIFYPSYVQTYLERDIRQVTSVKDLTLFQRFMELLAARTGSLLNLSELSRDCGVSHTTAQNWLSLLENSRIVYLLRPYFKNLGKRLVKAPKLYFTDTGLLAYLLKYHDGKILASGPMAGHIFENFLVLEFLKKKLNEKALFDLFFYRDSNKVEIDLIVENAQTLDMIEIKMRKNIDKRDVRVMEKIDMPNPQISRWLLSCNENPIKVSGKTRNLPWWLWNESFFI